MAILNGQSFSDNFTRGFLTQQLKVQRKRLIDGKKMFFFDYTLKKAHAIIDNVTIKKVIVITVNVTLEKRLM